MAGWPKLPTPTANIVQTDADGKANKDDEENSQIMGRNYLPRRKQLWMGFKMLKELQEDRDEIAELTRKLNFAELESEDIGELECLLSSKDNLVVFIQL